MYIQGEKCFVFICLIQPKQIKKYKLTKSKYVWTLLDKQMWLIESIVFDNRFDMYTSPCCHRNWRLLESNPFDFY